MNISVNIEGMESVMSKLGELVDGERMERALAAAGEVVRADAAANAPVNTGRLKNSIVCNVEGNSALIGSAVSYAAFVEFGTGAKGDPSVAHTTKKSWSYYSGGRFFRTSGMAPQPFLVPALTNNIAKIAMKFKEVYNSNV